jgi:hypothetical protein
MEKWGIKQFVIGGNKRTQERLKDVSRDHDGYEKMRRKRNWRHN